MEWKIGCSGFSYSDWQGIFYPNDLPQPEWLAYYATFFDTVELNVTFYRFPGVTFFKNLHKKSPDHFGFIVKAPKQITHINQFKEVGNLMDELYNVTRAGLQEKLEAILFQLPPSYQYSEERLEEILLHMDNSFTNVIEFRHTSWWNNKVYKELSRNNITFCSVSHPTMPEDVIINSPTPYYRFHGVPKLYYSMYTDEFIKNIADKIEQNKKVKKAFLLFNNTATRAGLENAVFAEEYTKINE